jgi:predicted 3-demethylubiquinone-9 3-methyltransferase (glyoxalase superfamily)
MATLQKIIPHFWFSDEAEEAVAFYISVFPNSSIGDITRYGSEGFEIHQMPEGTVMTVEFTLDGQRFVALNGGPVFTFNEAVSFMVLCNSQDEVDFYWDKLSAGGDINAQQCGWLKDQFGLSWQVVPTALPEMLKDKDQERSQRVMKAMLQMKKITIKTLEHAFEGKPTHTPDPGLL